MSASKYESSAGRCESCQLYNVSNMSWDMYVMSAGRCKLHELGEFISVGRYVLCELLGLCIISRYIECIDTFVMIWLTIYQIKSIYSHDMYQNIFLAIKLPHNIPQNSVLLHFYQFTANVIHI